MDHMQVSVHNRTGSRPIDKAPRAIYTTAGILVEC